MLTILLRTVLIYLLLMLVMRLMGKRQIGELEVSDLVTTLLLSEIASLPITDTTIPLAYALIPMIILLSFEVSSAYLMARFPALKGLASTRPSVLIRNGKIDRRAMLQSRISPEELMVELRQNQITEFGEVRYAILEQSGKITVIPYSEYQPPTAKQLDMTLCDNGLEHILISEGHINRYNLRLMKLSLSDIERILKKYNTKRSEVYLLLMDDNRHTKLIRKEDS